MSLDRVLIIIIVVIKKVERVEYIKRIITLLDGWLDS